MTQKTNADILAEIEAEELLAQLHEGAAPITDDVMELVEQYRKLSKDLKPIKAEQETIKVLILGEMEKEGVNKFTRNGVVEVEDIHYLRQKIDLAGILSEFPGAAKYVTKEPATRFDAKK